MAAVGALIAVIGTYLRQMGSVASEGGFTGIPCSGWPSIPGVQSFEFGLLALCGVVLLMALFDRGSRTTAALAGLTGLIFILLCFLYFPPWAFASEARCVPQAGWYMRLLGGMILLSVALLRFGVQRSSVPG
jgi:hypothetical protein